MNRLSELEGVCLGLVCRFQPCTAYRVRQMLKQSPSSHWRASAGSVYPLIARLEAAGLISVKTDEFDGRGRKELAVTPAGRSALRTWIKVGAEPDMVSTVMDPVRSRMFFINMLGARQRVKTLEAMIGQMEAHLAKTQARLELTPESEDLFGYLGALGAVRVTQARLEWLKVVMKRLKTDRA